jgi:hypothetical protein
VTLLLRLLAIRFDWSTRSLRDWTRRKDDASP